MRYNSLFSRGFLSLPLASRLRIGALLVLISTISGIATFMILTGRTHLYPTEPVIAVVLLGNALLMLFLITVITTDLFTLWRGWKDGDAGASLQIRVVSFFAFVATTPAIIVAVIAAITLNTGLDHWFSGRTQSIIYSSTGIAYAYMREHAEMIRLDASFVKAAIDGYSHPFAEQKQRCTGFIERLVATKNLAAIYIVDSDYGVLVKCTRTPDEKFLVPPVLAVEQARKGGVVILTPGMNEDISELGALVQLDDYGDTFLYVVRDLDREVIQHIRETAGYATEYQDMAKRRQDVQVAFSLMYVDIALTLLFSSIWTALWFSNRFVSPIRHLIRAADLVSKGDLDARVAVDGNERELVHLSGVFNSMIEQIQEQRNKLLDINAALDVRNRFTETVLESVTSGIVGIDDEGNIELINRSAEVLLEVSSDQVIGISLEREVPEFSHALRAVLDGDQVLYQEQVVLSRKGQEHTVLVRVTARGGHSGYVVTIGDITELVIAHRASAWRDIARRIAHEIKNPLTPIQLSAERLKRRYGASLIGDRKVFDQCIDTIVRQVGDIGRMVDEFSTVARMPKANMETIDIVPIIRETVFLFRVSCPEIKIGIVSPEEGLVCTCDRRLIVQMVTNLVKNASEAIAIIQYNDDSQPWIEVQVSADEHCVVVQVTDNGCGLPSENRQKLLEPYVTRRDKGTGLGLAIVQKIVEEHKGHITLSDAPQVADGGHGACITVTFPRYLRSKDSGGSQ